MEKMLKVHSTGAGVLFKKMMFRTEITLLWNTALKGGVTAPKTSTGTGLKYVANYILGMK